MTPQFLRSIYYFSQLKKTTWRFWFPVVSAENNQKEVGTSQQVSETRESFNIFEAISTVFRTFLQVYDQQFG